MLHSVCIMWNKVNPVNIYGHLPNLNSQLENSSFLRGAPRSADFSLNHLIGTNLSSLPHTTVTL